MSTAGEITNHHRLERASSVVVAVSEQRAASGLTYERALYVFIRGKIVVGVLSLPLAFFYSGFWTGCGLFLVIAVLNLECLHMLVRCSKHFEAKLARTKLQYADVAEYAFEYGPQELQRFAKASRWLVNACLFSTHLGCCCIYLLFVADNIQQVVEFYHPEIAPKMTTKILMALLLCPLLLLLCASRKIKILATLAFLGSIIHFTAIGIIFFYLFQHLKPLESLTTFNSWATLPLFFGSVMYAYEGIFWVLPIRNLMKKPKDFSRWGGVLNVTYLLMATLYLAFAFFGNLHFGAAVADRGSIALLLPQKERFCHAIKAMLCCSVFITYAVQIYIPIVVVRDFSSKRYGDEVLPITIGWHPLAKATLFDIAVTLVMVAITFALCELIPHLDLLISLIGCTSTGAQTIFPPVIEILTLTSASAPEAEPPYWGRCNWILWKNVLICLFGFLGFTTGLYISLQQIIQTF